MQNAKKIIKEKRNFLCLLGSIVFFLAAIFIYLLGPSLKATNNDITIGVFSDSFWDVQNGNSYRILNNAIKEFQKENPNVNVNYETGILKKDYSEWLAEKLLSEDAPDLFFILPEDFNNLVESGALKDLTSVINLQEKNFDENFYASAYSFGQYNNRQYALPFECAPKLMFVNQTLLEKEKIPIPGVDWSWDDFYSICQRVTRDRDGDGDVDQYGYTDYDYLDAFYSNNVSLFSEDGKSCNLSDKNVAESIEFIEKLSQLSSGADDKAFDLGNVAFKPMSFSEFRAYKPYPLSLKKYENFKWSCITMPRGSNGRNVSSLDCLQIGINSKTEHFSQAFSFMKVLTTYPDIQSQIFDYSEGVSALKEVTEKDQTLGSLIASSNSILTQEILSEAVDDAVVIPRFTNYGLAMLQLDQAVNSIIDSSENIDASLIQWNRVINRSLKNNFVNVND